MLLHANKTSIAASARARIGRFLVRDRVTDRRRRAKVNSFTAVVRRLQGSGCPVGAQKFRLLEDKLGCFILEVRWVAVLPQDAFDHDFDFGSGALADGPVDRDALADLSDKFGRDDPLVRLCPLLRRRCCSRRARRRIEPLGEGARWTSECVGETRLSGSEGVSRNFIVVQTEIDSALGGGAHLFRELDQLFDDFLGGNGAAVIRIKSLLQHLKARPLLRSRYGGKLAALDEISF